MFSKARPKDEVLVSAYNMSLTRENLMCLQNKVWLSSCVIDFYMSMLQGKDRNQRLTGQQYPTSHFFSLAFVDKLFLCNGQYTYKHVERWTAPFKFKRVGQMSECVLDCDKVLMPIHLGNHFTAICVSPKEMQI